MVTTGKLLAWITPCADNDYVAAFVSVEPATGSAPATRSEPATCHAPSPEEARQWVEAEAATLGATIEWLAEFDPAPRDLCQ